MRDTLLLYVNGQKFEIRGVAAFSTLTEFLRNTLHQCGTKVVCAEGDCGACTVLVGRPEGERLQYVTVDACIYFLHQLDCRHVVTVEGLTPKDSSEPGRLHPVQQVMVDHHGSQCGYCTPGFVMSLAGHCEAKTTNIRTALTGNLCRCTGYVPILEAAASIDTATAPTMESLYPSAPLLAEFRRHRDIPVRIEAANRIYHAPRTLADAIAFKASHPQAGIISGGTELGVTRNKTGVEPATLLSLAAIPGLSDITASDSEVSIGANATWTQIEAFAKEAWPEFYRIVERFGSPQIRNVATMAANIANGSPIADSLPFLFVAEAELDIAGPDGVRRVNINDFYRGYKIRDLANEEIIAQIRVPRLAPDEELKLYKVSRRNDLDIATFGAAIRIRKAGTIIARARVAVSGVAAMVVRLPRTEAFLQGKPFTEASFQAAGQLARSEIAPISDVRGSRDFRWQLAENILLKFYFDCTDAEMAMNNGKTR